MIVQTKTYEPIELKNLSRFEVTLEGHYRVSHFERYFVYLDELNHLDPDSFVPFGFKALNINVCLFHCLELYEAMRESFSEYVAYGKLETATCLQ